MATRSALASQALSELSRLNSSSYTPSAVAGERPAPLTRRVPRSSPAAEVPEEPTTQRRRSRSADDVRNRLSGFRAGVERGRGETVPTGAPAASGGGSSGGAGAATPGGGAMTTTQQTHRSTTKEEKR